MQKGSRTEKKSEEERSRGRGEGKRGDSAEDLTQSDPSKRPGRRTKEATDGRAQKGVYGQRGASKGARTRKKPRGKRWRVRRGIGNRVNGSSESGDRTHRRGNRSKEGRARSRGPHWRDGQRRERRRGRHGGEGGREWAAGPDQRRTVPRRKGNGREGKGAQKREGKTAKKRQGKQGGKRGKPRGGRKPRAGKGAGRKDRKR